MGTVVLVLAAGLSACSSSEPSSDASDSAASAATSSSVIAKAKAISTAALNPDQKMGVDKPLESAPAKAKTFVFLDCGTPQCGQISDWTKTALATAGWNYKVLTWNLADPSSLVAAMKTALQYNPSAVSFAGVPEAVWAGEIPAYQAAGVIIIPNSVGDVTYSSTVPAQVNASSDSANYGNVMANYIIADSGGKAQVLFVTAPDIGSFAPSLKAFSAVMKTCSGCKVTVQNITNADIGAGTVNPVVVSALQRNKAIKYVVIVDGEFTPGLPTSLSTAGLTGIKITGFFPSNQDLANIKAGTETAFIANPLQYQAWLSVDIAFRSSENMQQISTSGGGLPAWLLVQKNVPSNPDDQYNTPTGFQENFQKLWHVS